MEKPASSPLAATACRHLRNKKMYVPALAAEAIPADPHENDESFYWCNKTLGALGCDDDRVHPCRCQPGRSCHEA
jgi:hypothetical protein